MRRPEIARQGGAACLERTEPERPGKGFALAWAFPRLQSSPHDAFLVLDADCALDPQALRVLDSMLQSGARVLQANHRIINTDASPIALAAAVGRRLEYDLFFAPKSRCGLAVLLVGTGMVFHRSVLQQFPWSSHSCSEDTEYTIRLAREGLPVHFAANAWVEIRAAETPQQLRVQRSRWARGNLALGKSEALRLIGSGLRQRAPLLIDLGWTLLVLSRPLVLLHLAATQLAGTILYWLDPRPVSRNLFVAGLLLLVGFALYLSLGVLAVGLTRTRFRHLLSAPWVVVQLTAVALLSLVRSHHAPWNRTPAISPLCSEKREFRSGGFPGGRARWASPSHREKSEFRSQY